jgi:hypothetical protein
VPIAAKQTRAEPGALRFCASPRAARENGKMTARTVISEAPAVIRIAALRFCVAPRAAPP